MADIQAGKLIAILGLDPKQFNRGMRSAERRSEKFARSVSGLINDVVRLALNRIKQLVSSVQRLGRALTRALTVPITAIGTATAVLAVRFDKEMTKIETLVGINRKQVDAWRKSVLSMAPAVGRGPGELAKALFFVTSGGARGAKALRILEQSAKAAAAGLGDTAEIARAVTAAMKAYQREGLGAAKATDVLVATVREGNLEAAELAGSLGQVIPIAAQYGVTFAQVGGFIASFTKVGADAAEAATSLKSVLGLIAKPGEEAKDALKAMGLTIDDVRKSIAEDGFAQSLVDLIDIAERAGDTETLVKIVPNFRALAGVLATAAAQGKEFVDVTDRIENSLGVTDAAFVRTAKDASFALDRMKAAVKVLAIVIGNVLLPFVIRVADAIADLAISLSRANKIVLSVAVAIAAIALVLGPVILGILTLIKVATIMAAVFVATGISMLGFARGVGFLAVAGRALVAVAKRIGAALIFLVSSPIRIFVGALVLATAVIAGVVAASMDMGDSFRDALRHVPLIGSALDRALSVAKATILTYKAAFFNLMAAMARGLRDLFTAAQNVPFMRGKALAAATALDKWAKSASAAAAENKRLALAEVWKQLRRNVNEAAKSIEGSEGATQGLNSALERTQSLLARLAGAGGAGEIDTTEILAKHAAAMQFAAKQSAVFGDSFDLAAAQASNLKTVIEELLAAGVAPADAGVQAFAATLRSLDAAASKVEGLAAITEMLDDVAQRTKEVGMSALEAETLRGVDAIAALGEQLEWADEKTKGFQDTYSTAMGTLITETENAAKLIQTEFDMLSRSIEKDFAGFYEGLLAGKPSLEAFFQDIGQSISREISSGLAKSTLSGIKGVFAPKASEVAVSAAASAVPADSGFIESIKSTLSRAASIAKDWGSAFIGGFSSVFDAVKNSFASFGSGLAKTLGSVFSWIADTATAIFSSLAKYAPEAIGAVAGLFLASGGIVTGGPALAVLGDNPSGTEVVLPLERLKEFLPKTQVVIPAGGGFAKPEIIINVNNSSTAHVDAEAHMDALGRQWVTIAVAETMKEVNRQLQSGGAAAQSLEVAHRTRRL